MRFPKIPGRSAIDEAPSAAAPSTPQQHTGISAVPIPESVPPPLTSELTRSIRFTVSEPQGYYFEQVETFVQQVIDVLAFYEQGEDRWQQFAYEMQLEVDQQAHDAQRLRSEIELFKVQGSPLTNADGSYMTESQNSTLATVSADLNTIKDQLSASEHSRLAGQDEINRLQDLAAMRDQEIASLRAWGEQVIADMQSLQAHAGALEAQLAAAPINPPAPTPATEPAAGAEPDSAPAPPLAVAPAHVEAVHVEPSPVEVVHVEVLHADAVEYDNGDLDTFDMVPLVEVPTLEPEGFDTDHVEGDMVESDMVDDYNNHYESAHVAVEVPEVHTTHDMHPHAPAVEVATPSIEPAYEAPAETHAPVEVPLAYVPASDASPVETRQTDATDEVESSDSNWDLDSELPDGVSLPGTGEAAYFYPTAAPGAPLETHGVPMGVWAPELDPRITQALAEEAAQRPGPS